MRKRNYFTSWQFLSILYEFVQLIRTKTYNFGGKENVSSLYENAQMIVQSLTNSAPVDQNVK